jgi:hypothetical protein
MPRSFFTNTTTTTLRALISPRISRPLSLMPTQFFRLLPYTLIAFIYFPFDWWDISPPIFISRYLAIQLIAKLIIYTAYIATWRTSIRGSQFRHYTYHSLLLYLWLFEFLYIIFSLSRLMHISRRTVLLYSHFGRMPHLSPYYIAGNFTGTTSITL